MPVLVERYRGRVQDTPGQSQVAILLATHNGEKWLPEQLQSLLDQGHPGLHIVARDDASSDATLQVLRAYSEQAPGRMTLLDSPGDRPEGARANFSALVEYALVARPEFFFLFSDQDDVWHPDKVSSLLEAVGSTGETPVLAYSDMRVMDSAGGVLANSFMDYQRLTAQALLPRLLVQNHVSGCASMVNRAALELAWPLPPEALIHDWWLALITHCAGSLHYCQQPLLDYRQHDTNVVGARGYTAGYLWDRTQGNRGTAISALYAQARALAARLDERGLAVPTAVSSLLATRELARPQRMLALRRAGHTRRGLARNLPLWFSKE